MSRRTVDFKPDHDTGLQAIFLNYHGPDAEQEWTIETRPVQGWLVQDVDYGDDDDPTREVIAATTSGEADDAELIPCHWKPGMLSGFWMLVVTCDPAMPTEAEIETEGYLRMGYWQQRQERAVTR